MKKLIVFLLNLIILISISCKQRTSSNNKEISPDTKQLREEYILNYKKPLNFESINKAKNGEKIKVTGKYYCLFDSAIIIPGKYIWEDTTKTFITHNFAEDLLLISNGDTIIKKTITKKDFADSLPDYLKKYAVIFEPKFEGYDSTKDAFNFSFSISIPITDVGELMNLYIKRNGNISVSKSY